MDYISDHQKLSLRARRAWQSDEVVARAKARGNLKSSLALLGTRLRH